MLSSDDTAFMIDTFDSKLVEKVKIAIRQQVLDVIYGVYVGNLAVLGFDFAPGVGSDAHGSYL